MGIRINIANTVNRILRERNQSLSELSADIDIPRSSLRNYAKGSSNMRADTIEILADKLGITPAELVSGIQSSPEWVQAQSVLLAAQEIGYLPQESQQHCINIFLELVSIFSDEM